MASKSDPGTKQVILSDGSRLTVPANATLGLLTMKETKLNAEDVPNLKFRSLRVRKIADTPVLPVRIGDLKCYLVVASCRHEIPKWEKS